MRKKQQQMYGNPWWKTAVPVFLAIVCVAIPAFLVPYKMQTLGYSISPIDEEESWIVRMTMSIRAPEKDLVVRAMPPIPLTGRQRVFDMTLIGEGFEITSEAPYTVWRADAHEGDAKLVMKFRAQTHSRTYSLPIGLAWDDLENEGLEEHLQAEPRIQAENPELRASAELLRSSTDDVMGFVRALFDYVQDEVEYKKAGGPTDAVTAYRLGEASCNGKNRLFIALARSQGIPARICKGIILERGIVKTQSHSWSELYLNGQWIPFCPTGRYFAQIPDRYLEYPKIDETMFSYTKNIRFSRAFRISKGAMTPEEAFKSDLDNPQHILRAWGSLDEADFSLTLLMIILTIPIGVTVVTFIRNILGFVPFGTFLPALMAVSFRDMGLGWGLLLFSVTIILGVGLNTGLKQFNILHFPRISIVFTFVVAAILGLALAMNHLGYHHAAKVGMFPLAVITLTIERFSLVEEADSFRSAFGRLFISLLAASACYFPMMNFTIRSYVLVFPELLFVVVGLNLFMGVYAGLRLKELIRFRSLLRAEETA